MSSLVFSQYFNQYAPNLKAFAYHLTKDRTDAEDLYQDTMYKALRYQHQYQPKTNLQAWLMTIMRNTFINEWRKRRRAHQVKHMNVKGVTVGPQTTTANTGESAMTTQEIMSLLNKLDEGLRKPFLMAFKGYKYEEIATEMNLPLGTIKSRIHQARKLLKASIRRRFQSMAIADIID